MCFRTEKPRQAEWKEYLAQRDLALREREEREKASWTTKQ
jgi:hypothetical protein